MNGGIQGVVIKPDNCSVAYHMIVHVLNSINIPGEEEKARVIVSHFATMYPGTQYDVWFGTFVLTLEKA